MTKDFIEVANVALNNKTLIFRRIYCLSFKMRWICTPLKDPLLTLNHQRLKMGKYADWLFHLFPETMQKTETQRANLVLAYFQHTITIYHIFTRKHVLFRKYDQSATKHLKIITKL